MAIKFQCWKCKTPYSVKDELAGKKAACKKCKAVNTIPTPAAAPARGGGGRDGPGAAMPAAPPPNAEELAASVFADEPKAEAAEPTTVEFTCPECEAKVQVPADLAGKRTQCAACKNLVKVPELTKQEKLDWRKAQQRKPAGARPEEVAPEGTWTSTATERVSREALVEAGAIAEDKEQLTRTQRVVWWVTRLGTVAVLLGVGFVVWRVWNQNRETRAVERALSAVKDKDKAARWPAEARAEVFRGAGEFYLHTNQRDCIDKARANFAAARNQLATQTTSAEHDPIAIELALAQLDMGSSQPAEIDNRQRLPWTGGQLLNKELAPTLAQIHAPEARLLAIREVSRKLVEKGQPALAGPVALGMFPPTDALRAEGLAVAGLEILKAEPGTAEALANQALALFVPPPKENKPKENKPAKKGTKPAAEAAAPASPPISPALVGLCVALDKPELTRRLPPEARGEQGAGKPVPLPVIAGNIIGLARKGDVGSARQLVGRLTSPLDRMVGYVLIAEALPQDPPSAWKQDMDEAANLALSKELRGRSSPWLLLRLIRLDTRAGLAEDQLKGLAQAIPPDSGLQSWAQLEILRGQLAAKREKAETDRASAVTNPKSAAYFLAWEAIARNNAHLDGGTLSTAEAWDEAVRPFGVIGAVLGWQDGR